jgi:hypothetical protein
MRRTTTPPSYAAGQASVSYQTLELDLHRFSQLGGALYLAFGDAVKHEPVDVYVDPDVGS